ncbi:membrane protein [Salmonella enterica subsp. enterica]|uniref:Membrane protein n=1 Tax=Salmonella enterica I TaxID=59201 RepID=A0A447U0X0_SALET|nr:membrane protein [Salmonella enterica subsp. enterica]
MSTREDNATRSMGGKLALWVFYTFCGYFIWAMARCVWLMSAIQTEPVSRPNQHSWQHKRKNGLTRFRWASSGLFWGVLPGTPGLAKTGGIPPTLSQKTRKHAGM